MTHFRTTDIYLAAALRSACFGLLSYEKGKNERVYYSFEDTNDLRLYVQEYRYGNMWVILPRKLRDNVRDIKRMVQSGKKVGGAV